MSRLLREMQRHQFDPVHRQASADICGGAESARVCAGTPAAVKSNGANSTQVRDAEERCEHHRGLQCCYNSDVSGLADAGSHQVEHEEISDDAISDFSESESEPDHDDTEAPIEKAGTSSNILVLQALTRRSLAMDQANLVSYVKIQAGSIGFSSAEPRKLRQVIQIQVCAKSCWLIRSFSSNWRTDQGRASKQLQLVGQLMTSLKL